MATYGRRVLKGAVVCYLSLLHQPLIPGSSCLDAKEGLEQLKLLFKEAGGVAGAVVLGLRVVFGSGELGYEPVESRDGDRFVELERGGNLVKGWD